jgi:hypothetical protein
MGQCTPISIENVITFTNMNALRLSAFLQLKLAGKTTDKNKEQVNPGQTGQFYRNRSVMLVECWPTALL